MLRMVFPKGRDIQNDDPDFSFMCLRVTIFHRIVTVTIYYPHDDGFTMLKKIDRNDKESLHLLQDDPGNIQVYACFRYN